MKKRLLVSLLTLSSIFTLFACNNTSSETSSSSEATSSSSRYVGPTSSSSSSSSSSQRETNVSNFGYEENSDGTLTLTSYRYDDKTEPVSCVVPSSIKNKTVTSIGERCFMYANGITSIEIPASVTTIHEAAFAECLTISQIKVASDNQNYVVEDGILYNKDKTTLVYCPVEISKNISMPTSVTKIGGYAFYGSKLKGRIITWSPKVTTIGDYAFYKSNITTITLPDSVTSCGDEAFAYSYVTKLTLSKNLTHIGSLCLTFLQQLTSLTLPGSLKVIPNQSVSNNVKLATLVLEEGIEEIEDSAFTYNKLIKNVTFPSSLRKIGRHACNYFGYLENLVIPEGVEEIGDEAFIYGENLATVSLPSTLKKMGEGVFAYSQKLHTITLDSKNTSFKLDDGVLYSFDETRLLCYPSRLGKPEGSETPTRTSYEVKVGISQIDATAFALSTYLKTLSFPSTITRVGYSCLYQASITSLNIDMTEGEWAKVEKTKEIATSSEGTTEVMSEWNTSFYGTITYKE